MALVGKNRHYLAIRIERRHFNSTARRFGYGESAEPLLQDIIDRTPAVIEQVQKQVKKQQKLPAGFSQAVADAILGGLESSAQALARMPAD